MRHISPAVCLLFLVGAVEARHPLGAPAIGYHYAPHYCCRAGITYPHCPYYLGGAGLLLNDPQEEALRHLRRGQEFFRYNRLDDALAAFQDSLRIKSDIPDARFWCGYTLQEMDLPAPAADEYRLALRLGYPDRAVTENNLGSALAARGRWEDAVASFRQALRVQPDFALARQNLRWAEPRARLVGKLPAVAEGKEKPTDAAEAALLAEVAATRDEPALSARLWRQALEDKKERENLYIAACAALRTGEAKWRQQALTWLREDLARRAEQLDRRVPGAVEDVRQSLRQWRRERCLESVRAPAALVELPAAERKAWAGFWGDVAALIRRADERAAGRWIKEDGELTQTEEGLPMGAVIYYGDAGWRDYNVELQMRCTGECGVCVRAADPATRVLIVFDAANREHRVLAQTDASPLRVLRQVSKAVIDPQRWQRVRIEVKGALLRVGVERRELFSVSVEGHPSGKVGLWMQGQGGRFRALKVSDAEQVLLSGP
jgi:tetratricopeptide (TPR) repeat protein